MRLLKLVMVWFCPCVLFAQLPETNLWLIELKKTKDSLLVKQANNISQRKGYNNQPAFSTDKRSVFYSSAEATKPTEILQYSIRSGKKQPVTNTELSEYSPHEATPGLIYAVVVEKDSTQRIHLINTADGSHHTLLEPDSVGYYCLLNADTLVYYKLTAPHSLRAYAIREKKETWICDNPGRGFKRLNAYTLVYTQKDSTKTELYTYNFRTQKATFIGWLPASGEDIIWHGKLGLLCSEGSRILQWHEKSKHWTPVVDLHQSGIRRITRFALDEQLKYLVVVDNL